MNTFQKKSLVAALGGALAVGAAGTAHAVYVNSEGLGQALVYPYYTVRNGNDTLISVVNSTASAKVVKVRFLEGQNSKEVLDFNLYLSAYDVWTAAITDTVVPEPRNDSAARMLTRDKSCTVPAIPEGGVAFRNLLFTSAEGDTSLDRTKEGYVEILEMGTLTDGTALWSSITHVAGVPKCTGLPTTTINSADINAPTGGLFGGGTLINVPQGTDFSYDAVAFDQWSDAVTYSGPGSITPTLAAASPASATVLSGTTSVFALFSTGADAVSATIMHSALMNEYVIDSAISATTDWVVTMPTKRFYVALGTGSAQRPFQRNFENGKGACDDISLAYYDREERKPGTTVDFSPSLSPEGPQLCWEANVITFNNGNVLGSELSRNIDPIDPVTSATYPSGWARIGFPTIASSSAHRLPANAGLAIDLNSGQQASIVPEFQGLPTIGFAVQQYVNGNVAGALSNYGGSFVHKSQKTIVDID